MTALLSTRISICWPPAPPEEPTITLVLTTPNGFYLDLRINKSDGSLDWATAGVKTWLSVDPPQASFTSLIDSRSPPSTSDSPTSSEPSTDIGTFHPPLPNGDILETGSMSNPAADGKMMEYEEIWRRLPIIPAVRGGGVRCFFIESEDDGLRKAFIGRIGNREIGMIDAGEGHQFGYRSRECGVEGKVWETLYESTEGSAGQQLEESAGIEENIAVGESFEAVRRKWIVRENMVI